jgi:hypothetical protein
MANELCEPKYADIYDQIYRTDLVFREGCWRLCGDAHCCHFARYKPQLTQGFHEIPLLPGEWEYLNTTGYIRQYGDYRRLTLGVQLRVGSLVYESLRISTTHCPCSHDIRPTICRLYPLLPIYSATAGLIGVDTRVTIFDIIEEALDLPRSCKIDEIPLNELQKFMTLTRALGSEPVLVFHLMAYKLVKDVFQNALLQKLSLEGTAAMPAEQGALFMAYQQDLVTKVVDWSSVKAQLNELGDSFRRLHGSSFTLASPA